MTMRYEKGREIGEPGGVYEFNVKLRRLRGVKISDSKLYHETEDALHAFAGRLRKRFRWIDTIELRGRSNGWLAIEDPQGRATKSELRTINTMVENALSKFQEGLRKEYGDEESWSRRGAVSASASRSARPGSVRALAHAHEGRAPEKHQPAWMRAARQSIARSEQRRAHERGESTDAELEDKMKFLHEVWSKASKALRLRALAAAYPKRDVGGWDTSKFDVRAAIKIVEFAED
jgi:hypothetical protein